MKDYFQLQIKMTRRKLTAFGLNPVIGFPAILVTFIGLSVYLFSKTEYASYIYILIALSFISQLSESERNDFLKSCFKDRDYLKIRLIENSMIALPFIAFLAYQQMFLPLLILLLLTGTMALMNFQRTFSYTIPTPFYKRPFEFVVGFRNTFYLIVLAYFLTVMAVSVGNFNLGIFALLMVFLVSFSFYLKPENEYYVWNFIDTPRSFLFKKIKTGIYYSTILVLPILVALGIFFFSEVYTILIFLLLGNAYLLTIMVAKYSAYPHEMNLLHGILIGLSLLFPLVLIGIAPYFYLQSIKRLNDILE